MVGLRDPDVFLSDRTGRVTGSLDPAVAARGWATGTVPRLVVDDREASAFEVGKAIAHGLQLLGRVAHPVQ